MIPIDLSFDSSKIPWPDTPSIMTDEIAFELGGNQFPNRFYTTVRWAPNRDPFRLVHFFDWYAPQCSGGPDGIIWWLSGDLKKDAIKTDSQRRAYLRGVLASCGKRVSDTLVRFHDANACSRFRHAATLFGEIRDHNRHLLDGHDISQSASYTIPICSTLTINSTKEHLDDVFGPQA